MYFYFICVICGDSYEYKEEGSSCVQLGSPGICKRITECEEAMDSLKRHGKHDLLRCGFVKDEEVVCCHGFFFDRNPTIERTTVDSRTVWSTNDIDDGKKPNGKRMSERMCDKYIKEYKIKPEINFHIINGEDAKIGRFPHMAALGFRSDSDENIIEFNRCSGSLISTKFVLTAAHCMFCAICKNPVLVRFGVINITDTKDAQDIEVKNIILGDYNYTSKHNDISLIELMKDVTTSRTVYPACLYTSPDDPISLIITGWGNTVNTQRNVRPAVLQQARIAPVEVAECNSTFARVDKVSPKVIMHTQICAISESDACEGDSGGPLQVVRKDGAYGIVGIVSFGIGCGTKIPGVYTRVYTFLDWIEQKVWPG